jgi:hypothetical protein
MSSNHFLKELHLEKIRRQNTDTLAKPTKVDKAVGPDNPFCCAVCYTDGSSSGLVTPTSCTHKICLECYTKIAIQHKDNATCPECRTLYMKKENSEPDEYADMPPLISAQDLISHYIYDHQAFNIINNIVYDRINIINR